MSVNISAATATLVQLYSSAQPLSPVMVVDGHGVSLRVNRGHLLIEDGIGQHRRQRRIPRAQRTLRRIVVLATDGMLTLDATRWCADLGIVVVQVERSGRILLLAGASGPDDARLRRAQAGADPNRTRLPVARELLAQKLAGQARVARHLLGADSVAQFIADTASRLVHADTVPRLLEVEAAAANAYFAAWCDTVEVTFAYRDRPNVPNHWRTFTGRSSILDSGRSPRRAADPVNALLNYAYGLAEVECRLALIAVGLDPGLGVLHSDKKNRDSLAFDLLETVRPYIDERVLNLLGRRHFSARDFYETRDGTCRLMPTLTHELATWLPAIAQQLAPTAEAIAHHFIDDITGTGVKRTVLTKANSRQAQPTPKRSRTAAPRPPRPPATCRECGTQLREQRAKLCPTCWPLQRDKTAPGVLAAGAAELARRRAAGDDPTQTDTARRKRAQTLTAHRAAQQAWEGHDDGTSDLDFDRDVLPALAGLPLSALQHATGLSTAACSRIRSGALRPHRRHWPALAAAMARVAPDTTSTERGHSGAKASVVGSTRAEDTD